MVELQVRDDTVEVEVRGLHKLWALKARIRLPVAAVTGVRRVDADALRGWWKGWRVPGTHIPGVIVAGTYYRDGERHFWDVRRPDRAIEILLSGADYDRLFVEVDDPDAAIRRLQDATAREPSLT